MAARPTLLGERDGVLDPRRGHDAAPAAAPAAASPTATAAASPAATPEAGGGAELDKGTILLSLPLAISVGEMLHSQSLNSLPTALAWGAAIIAYRQLSKPGVLTGSLDWLVDAANLGDNIRERIGATPSERMKVIAPQSTRRGWFSRLQTDIANLERAIAVRTGAAVDSLFYADPNAQASAQQAAAVAAPAGHQAAGMIDQQVIVARQGEPQVLAARVVAPADPYSVVSLAALLDGDGPGSGAPSFSTLAEMLAVLPQVLELRSLAYDPRPYAVPLGVTPDGRTPWMNLDLDTVNVGIFGVTGVGKDMLLSQWIWLLCRKNKPDTIQFLIIDGKGDYLIPQLKGLAHMAADPVGGYGNYEGIVGGLDLIHAEAKRREALIYGTGYRNRDQYIEATGKPLPLYVVVVTDQMTAVEGVIEDELTEIMSKARSLGMRVIMSFQNVSGKSMGWRTQVGVKIIGYMDDSTQDGPALGIRNTKGILTLPSQLPYPSPGDPSKKGIFVVRHGRDLFLIKTPFTPDLHLLALFAKLPKRAGYRETTIDDEGDVAPPPSADAGQPASGGPTPHMTREDLLRLAAAERERAAAVAAPAVEASPAPVAEGEDALLAFLLAGSPARPAPTAAAPEPAPESVPASADDELAAAEFNRADVMATADELRQIRRASVFVSRDDRRQNALARKRSRGLRGQLATIKSRKKDVIPPGSVPPMPPIRPEEPSEPLDEKLYRMMLVPLGLNEIREALQKDKTALSRKCKKIREDRGMGGWPKPSQKPKMTQEQRIERMMRVPMGFNEIARVERINRNNLSKMCKEIAARAGISFEEEADEDRGDKE